MKRWLRLTSLYFPPSSHPDYTSEAPDPGEGGHGIGYRCLEPECGWSGRAGGDAYQHHASSGHHAIANKSGVRQVFSCCHRTVDPDDLEDVLS